MEFDLNNIGMFSMILFIVYMGKSKNTNLKIKKVRLINETV